MTKKLFIGRKFAPMSVFTPVDKRHWDVQVKAHPKWEKKMAPVLHFSDVNLKSTASVISVSKVCGDTEIKRTPGDKCLCAASFSPTTKTVLMLIWNQWQAAEDQLFLVQGSENWWFKKDRSLTSWTNRGTSDGEIKYQSVQMSSI